MDAKDKEIKTLQTQTKTLEKAFLTLERQVRADAAAKEHQIKHLETQSKELITQTKELKRAIIALERQIRVVDKKSGNIKHKVHKHTIDIDRISTFLKKV